MFERYKETFDDIHAPERVLTSVLDAAKQPRRRRVPWAIPAAAALLAFALLTAPLAIPNTPNAFVVKAYVMEQSEDGSLALRETDLLDAQDYWGGHYDGETGNYFINVALKYEGENIERVTFRTEDGFFARQRLSDYETLDGVQRVYVGPDNRLAVVGTDFDVVGGELTLDAFDDPDDLLLFWGGHADSLRDIPHQAEFTATALFRDGTTQQVPITLDLSGKVSTMSFSPSEAERREKERQDEYFRTLPLDRCELVEDSVMPVTDVYDYRIDDSGFGHVTLKYFDIFDSEFDKDGVFRIGLYGWTHIAVLRRDAEGNLTGMVYRIPEELQYRGES